MSIDRMSLLTMDTKKAILEPFITITKVSGLNGKLFLSRLNTNAMDTKKLREEIEKILRGQFVDSAYRKDGTTSWGIFDTSDKIFNLLETAISKAKREEREKLGYRECILCKKVKPLTDFYRSSRNTSKIDFRCKECHKKNSRNRLRDKYNLSNEHKKYLKRKSRGEHLATFKRMTEKYPEKYKARYTLRNAVKMGKVKKMPCEVCGDVNSTAHHEDYSKPLEVRWLCRKHHGLLTRKLLTQKEKDK